MSAQPGYAELTAWVKRMFKLQWSDYFVPLAGPMGRKDYFIAFFKLGAAYFISAKVISLLYIFSFDQGVEKTVENARAAVPLANALTQLILLWSVLALVHRRLQDVKHSVRAKYWAWRFTLPAALVVLIGANFLRALGLQRFVDADLISPLGPLVLIVIVAAGFLAPEDGTEMAETAKPVKLSKPVSEKPLKIPAPAPSRAYMRDSPRSAPTPQPVLAGSGAIQRTRVLPQQGRVRSGWFN
jgi:uncharacterized membrane protein YhaH (DUF805 family)